MAESCLIEVTLAGHTAVTTFFPAAPSSASSLPFAGRNSSEGNTSYSSVKIGMILSWACPIWKVNIHLGVGSFAHWLPRRLWCLELRWTSTILLLKVPAKSDILYALSFSVERGKRGYYFSVDPNLT